MKFLFIVQWGSSKQAPTIYVVIKNKKNNVNPIFPYIKCSLRGGCGGGGGGGGCLLHGLVNVMHQVIVKFLWAVASQTIKKKNKILHASLPNHEHELQGP